MSADLFPEDSAERKGYPVYSGLLQYFPAALAAVAHHSFKGNEKHNPEAPLHWDRAKSGDEADALVRHLMEGDYVGMAWRALALLQKHQEAQGAPIAPGARNALTARQIYDETSAIASAQDAKLDGTPAESAYLASFGPNPPKEHRRVLTDAERRKFGIGDVTPRHPMHAEALRDHDERLYGGEDRL